MAFYEDPRNINTEHISFPFSAHRETKYTGDMVVAAHYHEMIELHYINEGKISYYLGNNLYNAKKGDIIIINSGELHSCFSSSKKVDITVIQFEENFLYSSDKNASKIKYVWPFLYQSNNNPRVINGSCLTGLNLEPTLESILKECENMEYGFELLVKSDIYKLFYYILNYLKSIGKIADIYDGVDSGTMQVIDKVLDFVKRNYNKDITAKDGAKMANLSYSYFSRLFNSVMNMGFNEYLTAVRVSKSEKLLLDTDKSITEIAYECGFSTSSYFIMKFKEKNRIPPLGFRKKFKS